MQLFYSEKIIKPLQIIEIDDQENIHLTKVLRKAIGEKIHITNGKGELFIAEIISLNKKRSSLKIIEKLKSNNSINNLTIAIAPTKTISRIEWFIEKSVEIGINEIFLFTSQNSERKIIKLNRLTTKALSAMKQSLNLNLPKISDLYSFKKLLQEVESKFEVKLIAYCEETDSKFSRYNFSNKKTIVMIGPEGGFSIEEITLAKQFGFKSVTLGKNRLRTETAGIYICSLFNS